MSTLNERAHELCNAMAADADSLGIAVSTLTCGTRILDCGVKAPGGTEAGRRLAEICLAGLGTGFVKPAAPGAPTNQQVHVTTNAPIAACMASQYAGWELKGEKFFAMGSGPMRAAAGREELFNHIDHREKSDVCVGVLETGKLPPDEVCVDIAAKCGIAPAGLTLLAARTASPAGTLQIVARSIETALHKLHVLGFDLSCVTSGIGVAPLPPVAKDDLAAIGWTNDAILYGAHVTLLVNTDDAKLQEIGPRVPSNASPDHGRPFAEVFARYNHDFYKIDPHLFSPAVVKFINQATRQSFEFGQLAPEVLAESFDVKK
jgi:methenyltetrahydromethanopterin cyclohydrolase